MTALGQATTPPDRGPGAGARLPVLLPGVWPGRRSAHPRAVVPRLLVRAAAPSRPLCPVRLPAAAGGGGALRPLPPRAGSVRAWREPGPVRGHAPPARARDEVPCPPARGRAPGRGAPGQRGGAGGSRRRARAGARPLAPRRRRERGFNQSALLARALAGPTGLRVAEDALGPARRHAAPDRSERRASGAPTSLVRSS